jgi:hypothetical protein
MIEIDPEYSVASGKAEGLPIGLLNDLNAHNITYIPHFDQSVFRNLLPGKASYGS